jgi:hypothetical protein
MSRSTDTSERGLESQIVAANISVPHDAGYACMLIRYVPFWAAPNPGSFT